MDESKKRVINVTTPGEPSATRQPIITQNQPPTPNPTLAPATAAPKKINVADEPAAPVLPSMTGPTVITPSPAPLVEAALPSHPKPVEPPVQPTPPPADDMQNIPRFGELQPKIDSHPLFSGTPDSAPKKPRRWLRRLTWIFSTLLVLLIAAYLLIDSGVVRGASHLPFHIFKQPVAATTTPTITPVATNPYAGWKTYTDSGTSLSPGSEISLKYPTDWQVNIGDSKAYAWEVVQKSNPSASINARYIYLSSSTTPQQEWENCGSADACGPAPGDKKISGTSSQINGLDAYNTVMQNTAGTYYATVIKSNKPTSKETVFVELIFNGTNTNLVNIYKQVVASATF